MTDIKNLKNVGPHRTALFNKIGIYSVFDLLAYYPRDYEDRSKNTLIGEVLIDEINIIKARIISSGAVTRTRKFHITKFMLEDSTGRISAIWFNQPYIKNILVMGRVYIFIGKVIFNKELTILPIDFEDADKGINTGRIIPKYKLTEGLPPKIFRKILENALEEIKIPENLPVEFCEKFSLVSKDFAIRNIHFPKDNDAFFLARERLVFEELFMLRLNLLSVRGAIEKTAGIVFGDMDFLPLMRFVPFALTDGQKSVLQHIFSDFISGLQMNRLLHGDVGSGKTMVAAIACYIAVKNGYQAAIMAPTQVLAYQHFIYFEQLFCELGITVILHTGNQKADEKRINHSKISDGTAKIIIGTHALVQTSVKFNNIGLVITDEQHRFGVRQRKMLSAKGKCPHILVMTATPIPRSLALILYGDMDISLISGLPPNRQEISTYVVTGDFLERVLKFIGKELQKGNQAYFVCPVIEESKKERVSAVDMLKKIRDFLPCENIELLHGKMHDDEKNNVLFGFANGRIGALVATTVIEVGVNVPKATVMVVFDAHLFGLAELHQLRGRVGRGTQKSYCILISDSKSQIARQRLDALKSTGNGFKLAELDLEIRGPGDFFGTKQHGLPELRIANLFRDAEILAKVQDAIEQIDKRELDLFINKTNHAKEIVL